MADFTKSTFLLFQKSAICKDLLHLLDGVLQNWEYLARARTQGLIRKGVTLLEFTL